MWSQAAHNPVYSLDPGYGLASFFLGSSQVLGSFRIESSGVCSDTISPCACSDLAYHLLPSSPPIPHSHTCMPSKASAGTTATVLEGLLISFLFLIGSLQMLLGVFRAFFFPAHLHPLTCCFSSPMYPRSLRSPNVLWSTLALFLHAPR